MICTVDTSEFLGLTDSVIIHDLIQATNFRKDEVGLSIIEHLNVGIYEPIGSYG